MSDIQTFDQAADAFAGSDAGSTPDPGPIGGAPAAGEPSGASPSAPAGPPAADGLTDGQRQRYERENYQLREQARQAQEYVQAFSGLHPDDGAVIRQLLMLQQTDPAAAADGFLQVAAALKAAQAEAAATPPAPATMAEIQAYFAQEKEAAAVEMQVGSIQQEAAALGFPPGTEGYMTLLTYSRDYHNNDLQAGASALRAAQEKLDKAAVDRYLAGKKEQAMGAPPIAPEGAAGVPASSSPKTIAEADALVRAHLA